MSRLVREFAFQMVVIPTVVFMLLNAAVPLNWTVQPKATEYPFELSISLEKDTYRLGEWLNVSWVLTNIGEQNVTLYYSRDCVLDFIVLDTNLDHVFRYRNYNGWFLMIIPYPSIAPKANMTIVGTWEQIYDDLVWVDGKVKTKPISPGTYYIYGYFESPTYGYMRLRTPPVRVTITGS